MASLPYNWSRRQLILLSSMRIVLVPLLLLCCAPRTQPIISGEVPAFIFTMALGITNGLAGSLPMMLAPAKVPATLKEVSGNMMTLSYNVGLTAGSLIGYVFDSMLGPPIDKPCPKYPFAPLPNFTLNTTTPKTTLTSSVATAVYRMAVELTTAVGATARSTTAMTMQEPTTATVAATTATLAASSGMFASKMLTTLQTALDVTSAPPTVFNTLHSALNFSMNSTLSTLP